MLPFAIALLQMDCVFGDVPANLARLTRRENVLLCRLSPERLAQARAENPILKELM